MSGQQKVFLGGTCGRNCWRDRVISELESEGISRELLFNPVVEHWTPECQEAEDRAKRESPIVVYYLASPQDPDNPNSVSAYSLVEATMALYDDESRAVVVFDEDGLSGHVLKVMRKVEKDLRNRFPHAALIASGDLTAYLAERIRKLA
jgi:hypothetical protein